MGDSRIGNPCDFYGGTSALAEVSAWVCRLTGRWVGSGIVVSIKGGGVRRMHGRGQGYLPAAAGGGGPGPGSTGQPISRQCKGDDQTDKRKLERRHGGRSGRPH